MITGIHRSAKFRWFCLSLVVILWAASAYSTTVSAQDATSAQITSPKTGDQLFGVVPIIGTASNPNMMRYSLDFDLQDESVDKWFPIAGPITQQVTNGVLGQWDTTKLQGRYQIRLRVTLRNGTVLDSIVQGLVVNNKQPTALPTTVPSATPAPPTALPTAGPSPTSQIQQPPTNTARPVQPTVISAPTAAPAANVQTGPQEVFSFDALRSAFCGGVYIAIFGFAVLGVYSLAHPRIRRAVSRMRNDLRR